MSLPAASLDDVRRALRDVEDPEYPVSIVDMGLVRGVELEGGVARVRLTYTSLGCPCTELIKEDVRTKLMGLRGVDEVEIVEVYDEWRRSDMSKRALIQLKGLGVG